MVDMLKQFRKVFIDVSFPPPPIYSLLTQVTVYVNFLSIYPVFLFFLQLYIDIQCFPFSYTKAAYY